MKFQEILFTPELAKQYLDNNHLNNRPTRDYKVVQYSKDMVEGRWKRNTGEFIKISKSGNIIDGQHRLRAIIKSGVSSWIHCAFNIPDENFDVLDSGMSRNASDVFRIADIRYGNVIPSIIQQYCILLIGGTLADSAKEKRLSSAQVLSLYRQNESYWQEITKKTLSWYNSFARIVKPSVIGGLYAFLETIDESMAFIFMEQTFCPINADHEVITMLKNILMKDKMSLRRMPPSVRLAIMVKAWNFYRMNKPCKLLRFDPEKEMFPSAK